MLVLGLLSLRPTSAPASDPGEAAPAHGVKFTDIAPDPASGINYRRQPSPRNGLLEALKMKHIITPMDLFFAPCYPQLFDPDD
jgi:hypothetical protein